MYWPCLAGQSVFPVQTAVRYKIPLIIWGAHQGLEQVGMFSHDHEVEMTRRYRKDHDLMGKEAEDLINIFDTLKEDDIWQYRYPDDYDLAKVGVRGIYLGNYVRWDPKAQHELMIEQNKYQTAKFNRTFDTYDHVDCFNYMDLHDYIKYIKHGYTKVTDHATREIRHGRLTRNQAVMLVSKYENVKVKYADKFCEWIGIDMKSLLFVLNQHRSSHHWRQESPGNWIKINKLNYINENFQIKFIENNILNEKNKSNYITIGKGWP
jgi:hypothetical protein